MKPVSLSSAPPPELPPLLSPAVITESCLSWHRPLPPSPRAPPSKAPGPAWQTGRREAANWTPAMSGGPVPARWAPLGTLALLSATAELSHPHCQPLTSCSQGLLALGSHPGVGSPHLTGPSHLDWQNGHQASIRPQEVRPEVAGSQGSSQRPPRETPDPPARTLHPGECCPQVQPSASCWPGTGSTPSFLKDFLE